MHWGERDFPRGSMKKQQKVNDGINDGIHGKPNVTPQHVSSIRESFLEGIAHVLCRFIMGEN